MLGYKPPQNTYSLAASARSASTFATLGFFLLPFENLAIAPSAGWPAIAPIFFFASVLLSLNSMSFSVAKVRTVVALVIISSCGWISTYVLGLDNRFFVRDVFDAFAALTLGVCFAICLARVFRPGVRADLQIRGYLNAYALGSTIAIGTSSLLYLLSKAGVSFASYLALIILKRNEEMNRFAFFFAEPSFVSVHILGVLIPLTWLAWRLDLTLERNRLLGLGLAYILISVLLLDSARFWIDMCFLAATSAFFYITRSFKKVSIKTLLFAMTIALPTSNFILFNEGLLGSLTMGRVQASDDLLITLNSDDSLASRFFRTDAAYQAWKEYPQYLITGAGFGNIGALIDVGYQKALDNFRSSYMKEVIQIGESGSGPNIFNMHAKTIGEFGLIVYLLLLFALFDRRFCFLFLTIFWCYLQFDSYAFYGLWIYVVARACLPLIEKPTKQTKIGIENAS
ncbi:hypothetical protein KEM63_05640 [Halopseudomonas nanhaiensis]|uniref:hypothetical protein n=1 Tax=Halopseudomonas nanhaiensis TaxID=2830842 RepID=UPI001CC15A47|nr:hypothetical protein [Halopseudomonas nanhaiensis]UAW99449.1 hypothetical protein KEM63_05640 [Halopseudomonas nanhaiensis]